MQVKQKGLEGQPAKRTCVPYYRRECAPPRCPIHGVICKVYSSSTNENGRTQYLKCDVAGCKFTDKVVIPAGSSNLK